MTDRGLLDMALDDIVKQRIDKEGSGRGRGRGGRGGARGRRGAGAGSGGALRQGRQSRITSGVGGYQPYQKRTERGTADGYWQHDMFDEEEEEEEEVLAAPRRISSTLRNRLGANGAAGASSAKVQVSNLEHTVTQEDLEELFGTVGELQKVVLKYDRSGRSNGIADVFFARRADAVKAVRDYNNMALDGKPMALALAASTPSGAPVAVSSVPAVQRESRESRESRPTVRVSLSGRPTQSRGAGRGFSRGARGSRGGFRGGRGGRTQNSSNVTSEDLDAELDAYNMDQD